MLTPRSRALLQASFSALLRRKSGAERVPAADSTGDAAAPRPEPKDPAGDPPDLPAA